MKAKRLFTSLLVLAVIALAVFAVIPGNTVSVQAQDTCGPMDVVFLMDDTGSMRGAIDNVKAEAAGLVGQIVTAAGGDYQMGLVTFKDYIVVLNDLAPGNADLINSGLLSLVADGGNDTTEASDESLNTAINRLPAAGRPQTGDFNGSWRTPATKIAILITDAPPGGFNDTCTPGVDDVNAHTRAVEAEAAGILISAVYVPTGSGLEGASNNVAVPAAPTSCDTRAVMQDYATTTGGVFVQTNSDGTGTANAIRDIISGCGAPANPTPAPTPIPEPTTILLLGSGAAGLAAYLRKRRQV